MKCVIIFVSCVLAVASAGYSAYGPSSYGYQDNGAYRGGNYAGGYNGAVNHGGYAHGSGVPQDTHEVAAAKAAHLQAHAAATSQAHASSLAHSYSPVAHGYSHAAPVAHGPNGAPLPVQDTYEVAAAKAAHFQAHAIARDQAHASPVAHGYSHVAPVSHGYAHAAPVAHGYAHGPNGAPLPVQDTYEVAAAKAAHFQAHAAAKSQANASPLVHGYSHAAHVAQGYAHVAPIAYAANGAPLPVQDTYEVAAAKAAHLQAHAAAKSGHSGFY